MAFPERAPSLRRVRQSVSRLFARALQAQDAEESRVRPFAPPLLVLALGLWAGCAVCYSAAFSLDASTCALVALVSLLGTALGGVLCVKLEARQGAVLLLGVLLGASVGFAGALAYHADSCRILDTAHETWLFKALSDERESAFASSITAQATSAKTGESFTVEVSLPKKRADPIFYGECFTAVSSMKEPDEKSAQRDYREGIVGTCALSDLQPVSGKGMASILCDMRKRAIDLFGQRDDDAGALSSALVCGYRGALRESELYASFKAVGLAHMVAVSGAHLSIVGGFLAALLRVLRCRRMASIALQCVFLVAYLVLTAAPVSAVRASIMAIVGMTSFVARRRRASMASVGMCILGMIVASPETAVSVSFFLSAASTLCIVALSGLFESWLARVRFPSGLSEMLALTLSASVVTTPYSAALFSQLPLISPVANIVAAPLFTLSCVVGLAAAVASLAFPACAPVALGISHACSALLAQTVGTLASAPFASVPASLPEMPTLVASIGVAWALWMWWPRPRAALLAGAAGASILAFALCVFIAPRFAPDEIIMLDVGQGDAFIVRSRGSCVLVDTGNSDARLLSALARHGVYRIDAVAVSHADDDHCASLPALRGVVSVGSVAVAADAASCECSSCKSLISSASSLVGKDNMTFLRKGDVMRCGNFSLRVVAPASFRDEGGNADSVCLLARLDANGDGAPDASALFCGDAESEQLEELIGSGEVGDIDVYKVGHHGSKAAVTPEVARALSPAVSLVSVGAKNRYGHPAASTVEALEQVGSAVFRTDEQGDVSCEFDATGMRVSTLR